MVASVLCAALYLATEALRLIAWRGRGARPSTLETYIQEVAPTASLLHLSGEARDLIALLADLPPALRFEASAPRR